MRYRFTDFELDTEAFELKKDGVAVHLEPQVFDVLSLLVQNHHRVVSKDEIMERVWGDRFISDAALNSRVMAARRAIADNGREQQLIKTVHGRGFRFAGDVLDASVTNGSAHAEGGQTTLRRDDTKPALSQSIRFCTTSDGVRIAFSVVGSGPPIVKAPNWLTHLEYEWETPVWRHWWEELARDHQLIRFDQRGCGLSDRDADDISFQAWVSDLEAVVEAAGVQRFALLGISQGGAVALEYAARHPERVSRLLLYGAFARGRLKRDKGPTQQEHEAWVTLVRQGWGMESPVYRQMFTSMLIPDATQEEMRSFNALQRASTTGDLAARTMLAASELDISDRLPAVLTPALVLHAIDDQSCSFDEGRRLASILPNGRLVPVDSPNHLLLEREHAWQVLVSEVRRFLAEDQDIKPAEAPHTVDPYTGLLSLREVEVLRLLASGKSNQEIADSLVISLNTVRRHVSNIFDKTGVANRAQAALYARDHDLV